MDDNRIYLIAAPFIVIAVIAVMVAAAYISVEGYHRFQSLLIKTEENQGLYYKRFGARIDVVSCSDEEGAK